MLQWATASGGQWTFWLQWFLAHGFLGFFFAKNYPQNSEEKVIVKWSYIKTLLYYMHFEKAVTSFASNNAELGLMFLPSQTNDNETPRSCK